MINKRIKQARKATGLNQIEFAELCGWDQGRQSHYETGRNEPSLEQIKVMAKKSGMSFSDLIHSEKSNVSPAHQTTQFIPIISSVQAGGFSEAIDLYEPGYAEETIARINGGDKVFALYVDGDSMTAPAGSVPSFPEGYIVHVDPEQPTINGDCVIAKVKGANEATFKQLKYDGGKPYLKPLNPDHKPIFDEFKIIGKVIGASIKF